MKNIWGWWEIHSFYINQRESRHYETFSWWSLEIKSPQSQQDTIFGGHEPLCQSIQDMLKYLKRWKLLLTCDTRGDINPVGNMNVRLDQSGGLIDIVLSRTASMAERNLPHSWPVVPFLFILSTFQRIFFPPQSLNIKVTFFGESLLKWRNIIRHTIIFFKY